jgi:uncharacterized protein with PIN domain
VDRRTCDAAPVSDARISFEGSLVDFLPSRAADAEVRRRIDDAPSVKDAIEARGVPHPEVDLVLVDGRPVGFDYRVRPGDRIAVYGLDRSAELAGLPGLMPAPPEPPVFVADGHLGRLARYLRTLGFDTWYEPHAGDGRLARVSADEDRILLTRDRGLLKRSIVRLGYLPRSDDPAEQLREVAARYGLAERARPFSRCVRCNSILRAVDRAAVAERLANEPRTLRYFDTFAECSGCGSIYWPGSHFDRLSALLGELVGAGPGDARQSTPRQAEQEGHR